MNQLDDGEAAPKAIPDGRGGRRAGSGRPPRGKFVPRTGDREYAKDLISSLMRDETQAPILRARCALAIAMKGTWRRYDSDAQGGVAPAGSVANPVGGDQIPPGRSSGSTPSWSQLLGFSIRRSTLWLVLPGSTASRPVPGRCAGEVAAPF
jgi:hypothetical protein